MWPLQSSLKFIGELSRVQSFFCQCMFSISPLLFHQMIIGQLQTTCLNFVVELNFVAIEVIGLERLQCYRLFFQSFQRCVCYFWEFLGGMKFTALTPDIYVHNFSIQLL